MNNRKQQNSHLYPRIGTYFCLKIAAATVVSSLHAPNESHELEMEEKQ